MSRVFISHSSRDRAIVEEQIIRPLTEAGIVTWYAKDDIRTAEEWERSIVRGLIECEWFLLVMSRSAAESRWVRSEVHWAFDERQGRIIPVMIEECEPIAFHLMMRQIQCIDFRADTVSATRQVVALLDPRHSGRPTSQELTAPRLLRLEEEKELDKRQLESLALVLQSLNRWMDDHWADECEPDLSGEETQYERTQRSYSQEESEYADLLLKFKQKYGELYDPLGPPREQSAKQFPNQALVKSTPEYREAMEVLRRAASKEYRFTGDWETGGDEALERIARACRLAGRSHEPEAAALLEKLRRFEAHVGRFDIEDDRYYSREIGEPVRKAAENALVEQARGTRENLPVQAGQPASKKHSWWKFLNRRI